MMASRNNHKLAIFVLSIIAGEVLILLILLLHSVVASRDVSRLENESRLVQSLHISDLCLVTESRHTRNISQPEPVAPFQDMPGYHDHFPSSTFLAPPAYIGRISR